MEHKYEWAQNGGSILSNRWHDNNVQKDTINFLINSPKCSTFIRSMDDSEVVKDASLLYEVLDDTVEVTRESVVQVVTKSASNYIK